MLAVLHVAEDKDRHRSRNDDGQQVLVPPDDRQPSGVAGLVDDADLSGALRLLPQNDEICAELNGDIVHHQGEQGFIGIPLCLADRRDQPPDSSGNDRRDKTEQDHQPIRQTVSKRNHTGSRCKAADHDLSLASDVPELHAKRRRHRQRDQKKDGKRQSRIRG